MMAHSIDPVSTRRCDVPGINLILADAQAWSFASPTTRMRPRFRPDGTIAGVISSAGHSPAVEREITNLSDAFGRRDEGAASDALGRIATLLLTSAHDIDPQAARELVIAGLDARPDLIDEILAIALGEPSTGEPAR